MLNEIAVCLPKIFLRLIANPSWKKEALFLAKNFRAKAEGMVVVVFIALLLLLVVVVIIIIIVTIIIVIIVILSYETKSGVSHP